MKNFWKILSLLAYGIFLFVVFVMGALLMGASAGGGSSAQTTINEIALFIFSFPLSFIGLGMKLWRPEIASKRYIWISHIFLCIPIIILIGGGIYDLIRSVI